MNRRESFEIEFVDRIPRGLSEGVLYVSEKYSTAAHNCFCGCGAKVVTPLKPGRWSLTKSKTGVSLSPSVGNWSLPCQSHYILRYGRVDWARSFTAAEISANRRRDKAVLEGVRREERAKVSILIRFWRWLIGKA